MRRRFALGMTAVLLLAACPTDHDPYTAMEYRRDEVVRGEAGKQYRLRIAAEQEANALADLDAKLKAVRVPTTRVVRAPKARASRSAPRRRGGGRCGSLEDVKRMESGGNYAAQNRSSSASGGYQYLDSTWNGYGGYRRAKDAPPEVQDQRAREDWAAGKQRQWVVCH